MKYANVTMKDHEGNEVETTGIVSTCGTFVVATIARFGSDRWYKNANGAEGSSTRNLAYADISIMGFQTIEDAEDGEFVKGTVGAEIIASTPLYMKQYMAPNGDIGDPFQNSILDYQYQTGPKGQQTRSIVSLFGNGIEEMITESVNKAFIEMNERHEAGENVRRRASNSKLAMAAKAVMDMVGRESNKKGTTNQRTETAQRADQGSLNAEDVLPD